MSCWAGGPASRVRARARALARTLDSARRVPHACVCVYGALRKGTVLMINLPHHGMVTLFRRHLIRLLAFGEALFASLQPA